MKDKDLIYTLSIDNKGTVPVEYDITLVGLPEGSYEVEDNLMVPGGQVHSLIILFKDAIRISKLPMGCQVKITSADYYQKDTMQFMSAALQQPYPPKAGASEYVITNHQQR